MNAASPAPVVCSLGVRTGVDEFALVATTSRAESHGVVATVKPTQKEDLTSENAWSG